MIVHPANSVSDFGGDTLINQPVRRSLAIGKHPSLPFSKERRTLEGNISASMIIFPDAPEEPGVRRDSGDEVEDFEHEVKG